MRVRLLFYLRYVLFWMGIFIFFRFTFIIYHHDKLHGILFVDILNIFFNGLKHDISLTGYILLFPTVLLILLSPIRNKVFVPAIKIYSLVLLLFVCLLLIIDHELYNYWGFRLDDTFIDYISTPKEMLASLEFIHFVILLVAILMVYLILFRMCFRRWVIRHIPSSLPAHWPSSPLFLVIGVFLLLPIRGGIGTAPLNTGSVYFHPRVVVNHAAINPVWNFIYALTEEDKLKDQITFFDDTKMLSLVDSLKFVRSEDTLRVLSAPHPNIIIIILESFGGNTIHEISGKEGVTPNFSRFIHEGIFFTHFFASGTLSDRGIAAILSGYPSLPKTCILHYENKSQNLPSITRSLKALNYHSKFIYGGDIDFAHIKSYLINCQFDQIISHKDFPKAAYFSKWGVPDHIVFERLLQETNQAVQPFFYVFFTLSSHEPFDVPMETVIEGNDRESKLFNSVYYTDKSLGEFIDTAHEQPWWENTLVILVADHGTRIGNITHYDIKRFHIPMLWLGGALIVKDTLISKYACQTDIPSTLLRQLNINTEEYLFGKDIFDMQSKSFAYYTCQNGFSVITDSIYLVYDLANNEYIEQKGPIKKYEFELGKAYLQNLLKDFSNR